MTRHDRNSQRLNAMRRNIASLAARLMAEDGIADYGLAKRKAARQLGVPNTEALPNNGEIEAELRAYQDIYQEGEHKARLLEMRRAAAEAMRLLEPYRPYLTGPVLDGTAGRYAEIELEAFPDSSKEIEIFLLNKGIHFEQDEPKKIGSETPECVLTFDQSEMPIRLSVFNPAMERARRRRNGRISERARLPAVEALLENPAS